MMIQNLTALCLICSAIVIAGCVSADRQIPDQSYVMRSAEGGVIGVREVWRDANDIGGETLVSRAIYTLKKTEGGEARIVDQTSTLRGPDGETLGLEHIYTVAGRTSQTSAVIKPSAAIITRTLPGDVRTETLILPPDTRFDHGAGLLNEEDRGSGFKTSFHVLDIEAPAVNRVEIQETARSETGDRTFQRLTWRGDVLLSLIMQTFDAQGKFTGSQQPMFGMNIQTLSGAPTPADGSVNLVRSVLVKSPVRISSSALRGRIRYTFARRTDQSVLLPETGEQIVKTDGNSLTVDVCQNCGAGLPNDADYLADARRATFWLQSDHPRLQRFVRNIANANISDTEKMNRLSASATRRMNEIDFTGHVSALEALQRGSGDCTETAVLLAALGRAAGIPTRVASGIVYSRARYHGVSHTFMPHAWTLAYVDGEWRSFDMALDGFDASHIAFTISDGDPDMIAAGHRQAGLLEWDAITEVRKR